MTVRVKNYLTQAWVAEMHMTRDLAEHDEGCIIWTMGDLCDCTREGRREP